MVSCRNVLIYFGPQLQSQVISTFHYALRPNGFLLLGSSETIREFTDMFLIEDRAHKFFLRVGESHGRSLMQTFPPVQLARAPMTLVWSRMPRADWTLTLRAWWTGSFWPVTAPQALW